MGAAAPLHDREQECADVCGDTGLPLGRNRRFRRPRSWGYEGIQDDGDCNLWIVEDIGGSTKPVRWLAEGRDASATLDAAGGGFGKNDGDNEITGVYVSDGDPGVEGILGVRIPNLNDKLWRWFYTQQHGDNSTFEVVRARGGS